MYCATLELPRQLVGDGRPKVDFSATGFARLLQLLSISMHRDRYDQRPRLTHYVSFGPQSINQSINRRNLYSAFYSPERLLVKCTAYLPCPDILCLAVFDVILEALVATAIPPTIFLLGAPLSASVLANRVLFYSTSLCGTLLRVSVTWLQSGSPCTLARSLDARRPIPHLVVTFDVVVAVVIGKHFLSGVT